MTREFPSALTPAALLVFTLLVACGPLGAQEPFDYFRNSWNVIGLKDYERGTRVTPDNRLMLADDKVVRLRFGQELTPLNRKQTKLAMDGWLPVLLITAVDGPVRYEFTLWATPLPTVKDWRAAFDWPVEGENFLNWVLVEATNTGATTADAKVKVESGEPGALKSDSLTWSLASGQSGSGAFRLPFQSVEDASIFDQEEPKLWLDRTVAYWRGVMAKAAHIEVPCRRSGEALLAAHVCQLIANDHGEVHGGEGFYDRFYIRDGAYQLMELEEAGMWDAARKAVGPYLTHQRHDGRFESQKGQFDANGQAQWVLWQYYKMTDDRAWLERVYPQMRRAAQWTMKARREAPANSPFAGVLPNALADGEYLWNGKYHIVGYDFWNLRGMLCTADAARILRRTSEAEELLEEAGSYRTSIDAAWRNSGLPHFPPSWENAGTHWGNTETLWPTEIFPEDDARVTALIKEVRENHGGGYVEGTIRWLGRWPDCIHPYMGAYTTMTCLVRGEHEKVVEDYYWYLLHSTAAHAFPEGIFYKHRFAWVDTIPHVTGAGNYAIMLRHMLAHERGDELHLLRAVPDSWLADGQAIRAERLPTHFGVMNLTIRGATSGVRIALDPPRRNPPRRIVLHLPESRPLVGTLPGVEVIARPDQATRWDFPAVVSLYRKHAPELFKPIPGLVAGLPVEPPITPDRCRLLDLAPLTNTDPFAAPFGVPDPGKLVFTGMPVGVQKIGGVPFRIIDPTENDGRALIVFHSPRAPSNRTWPKQVEIAVREQGKWLFLLGNILGWSTSDLGTGEWGAVAEYVIHYADGKTQTIPLIPGRTADEWALPPAAQEVLVGLRGDPWHLNVLGVSLRDVAVEKILFRDLGTTCAPVLAAVTLEK